jgi:hypothetical protein
MVWEGKELNTLGEMMDAMSDIYSHDDKEAATRFMELYRAECEYADSNIGYLTGYMDSDTMRGMQKLFSVSHPVFGDGVPSPQKAFNAGYSSENR